MTPLPPLPLFHDPEKAPDGALIFDNSTIELLKCPRLLEQKWLRKRDLVASRAGRNFGSTLHAGWAVRSRMCGNNAVTPEAAEAINETMRLWLEEHPQPTEDFRNYQHACRVMEAYNKNYGNEPFTILRNPKDNEPIVENNFLLPFGKVQNIAIFYAGKIDTAIEDHNGVWSFDHKTTFQFGETWEASMLRDGGQIGYTWALSQVLNRRINGYIIDGVRIRRPSRKSEFTGDAPVDSSDFIRLPFALTDEIIESWKRDVLGHIHNIITMHDAGFFPEARWNCTNKFGKCDFFDVCSLPPSQRDGVLYHSTLYEENEWTPLNIPKTKEESE